MGRGIEWLHVEVVAIYLVRPVTLVYNYKENRKQHSLFGMMCKLIKIKRMKMTEIAGYWDMLSIRMKDFENSLQNTTLWNSTTIC